LTTPEIWDKRDYLGILLNDIAPGRFMPKIEGVIKSEILRLAKRHVKMVFLPLKREVRQMNRRLSGLSRTVAFLNRAARQMRQEEVEPKLEATPEEVKTSRITPERIIGLRRKLGISQRELGILTGASVGAVLSWEKGKFRPKPDKKAALVALRKLGKRGVEKLLAEKAPAEEKPKKEAKPEVSKPRGKGRLLKGAVPTKRAVTKKRMPAAKKSERAR
jgi:DNA-binding transcriptional regulator YiaG